MRPYTPQPVNTKSVKLDSSLQDLAEYLARNTHEVWGAERLRQGWTWGAGRDDGAKTHPCLIPYEQLSEDEKHFDRETAAETLKLITAYGYTIQPPAQRAPLGLSRENAREDIAQLDLAQLVQYWKDLGPRQCHGGPELYLRLGKRATEIAEYLLAYDIFQHGLHYYPGNELLLRRQAFALQRSGAPLSAAEAVQNLINPGTIGDDAAKGEETYGLLASIYKDLWSHALDPIVAHRWLVKACDAYEKAFEFKHGHWPAINLATLALCLGQSERAKSYADIALKTCTHLPDSADESEQYWKLATIGEAYLLLNDLPKAEEYYKEAAKVCRGRLELIRGTRANARLIFRYLHLSDEERLAFLRRCLDMPRVVVFSGHQVDAPDRALPRFPAQRESAVAGQIEDALASLNCGFGYSSAACGSDILFLEALLRRKSAHATVVLPFERERFLQQSVAPNGGNWAERFKGVLASDRVSVIEISQEPIDEGISYDYANRFIFGLAAIRAQRWSAELKTLTVWDGKPGNGPGGTRDAVEHWRRAGREPVIIDPGSLARENRSSDSVKHIREVDHQSALPNTAVLSNNVSRGPVAQFGDIQPRMAALVFTDIVDYSKIPESKIPLVIEQIIRRLAVLAQNNGRRRLHMSTWGDAFYVVFEGVKDAGEYALELQDLVESEDWIKLGFDAPISVRTALHFGPVYQYTNPMTHQPDFIGTHVSRTARMEPKTPPNHVYASEAFAAIASADGINEFCCDYVGQLGLDKNYGIHPAYHVRRTGNRIS